MSQTAGIGKTQRGQLERGLDTFGPNVWGLSVFQIDPMDIRTVLSVFVCVPAAQSMTERGRLFNALLTQPDTVTSNMVSTGGQNA